MAYIRCPRCELNYIKEEDELCEVCKAELANKLVEEEEEFIEDNDTILCPICKINYIFASEGICPQCKSEQKQPYNEEIENEWDKIIDSDEEILFDPKDEETFVSLSEIAEEESDVGEDDENLLTQEDLLDIFENSND